MKRATQPVTRPRLSFARAPIAQLDGLDDKSFVFAGIRGDTGNTRANATPEYASAASAVRAASNELLRPYVESPSGTAVDLDSGQRTRQRNPNRFKDLGDLVSPESGDWNGTCSAICNRVLNSDLRPILVGGDDDFISSLISSISRLNSAIRIFEISDRCVSARTDFSGPILTIGASGFLDADSWARQLDCGGAVVPAEKIHVSGTSGIAHMIADFTPDEIEQVCILDCRAVDVGYASGSDSFTVGGLTPEQFVSLARMMGTRRPPMVTVVLNLDPSHDPRGHMEYLVAEALHNLYVNVLFEDAVS